MGCIASTARTIESQKADTDDDNFQDKEHVTKRPGQQFNAKRGEPIDWKRDEVKGLRRLQVY